MANQTLTTTPSPQPVYIDQNDGSFVQQYGSEYRYVDREIEGLITQASTAIPTSVVLKNTLGGTVVYTRVSAGVYRGTLAGAFLANKVIAFLNLPTAADTVSYGITRTTDNYFTITTSLAGTPTDGLLTNASFKVIVRP